MASEWGTLKVEWSTRSCMYEDESVEFHGFFQSSTLIINNHFGEGGEESETVSSAPCVVALIETKYGDVKAVSPEEIKFTDVTNVRG